MYTYLLTPWSRVLLEKLTGFADSQEIRRIYGTRKFITVFTSVRHLSLSWARSIQCPQSPPTTWRSLLILSSHLRLGLPNGPVMYNYIYISFYQLCIIIYNRLYHFTGYIQLYISFYRLYINWESGMPVSPADRHTRQSPTQSDTYQMMYWYIWFSWWWALGCSKHVEKWNK
jgi:hypothetical protein